MAGPRIETGVFGKYGLTEEKKARTIGSKMNSCARLSINVMELLGMVMNAFAMAVIRVDGPEREEGPVMVKRDNISTLYWVRQCHEGKDALRARELMRLTGLLRDRSRWCLQAKNVKGIMDTLTDGLTRSVSSTLHE